MNFLVNLKLSFKRVIHISGFSNSIFLSPMTKEIQSSPANKNAESRVDSDDDKTSQENNLEGENTTEKVKKRTLFNDLKRFKKKTVSILTYGGETIQGKLIGYDKGSNCFLETENRTKIVVFGKLISMVCDGELHTF